MRVGTKSVLFGAHCFFIHPWFVALAWWKLYGFPWDPRLWVAFFIHDLGYWGKPEMDGKEGERHPEWGAMMMFRLFDRTPQPRPGEAFTMAPGASFLYWKGQGVVLGQWGNFALYHSRFYAKKFGARPSHLCIADKLAIALTPWWLYLPMVIATGEIREYVKLASDRRPDARSGLIATEDALALTDDFWGRWHLYRAWYKDLEKYMREWVGEHRDGREDTWTPDTRKARGDSGVWE